MTWENHQPSEKLYREREHQRGKLFRDIVISLIENASDIDLASTTHYEQWSRMSDATKQYWINAERKSREET